MVNTRNKNSSLPQVSSDANNQFKNILKKEPKDTYVRLFVDAGGCSGFSYKFSVDNNRIYLRSNC